MKGRKISSKIARTMIAIRRGHPHPGTWIAPAENMAEAKQVTFGSPGQNAGWNSLLWTPDGRIVYTADSNGGTTIWIIALSTHGLERGGNNSAEGLTDIEPAALGRTRTTGRYRQIGTSARRRRPRRFLDARFLRFHGSSSSNRRGSEAAIAPQPFRPPARAGSGRNCSSK